MEAGGPRAPLLQPKEDMNKHSYNRILDKSRYSAGIHCSQIVTNALSVLL